MSAWKLASIGDLVEPVSAWTPSRDDPDGAFTYVDLSAVDQDIKIISGERELMCADAPSRARLLVREGDILVSTVRPNLNSVARVPYELDGATASTGFCVLRPRLDSVDGRYLFQWVRSGRFVSEMVRMATGASYPAVSDRIVCESRIPLPPLPEQRRIAEILDKADVLRAKRRAAIAKIDGLAQAIFVDMFGDPIENPNQFPVAPLIDLVDPKRPISYGILMPGPDQATGVPYVRVVDMQNGGIKTSGVRRTTEAIARSFSRSQLKTGDLLMSIRGHVGRFAVVPPSLNGANITQDSARLAITGANSVFVRECLRSAGCQRWMTKRTRGVAVRGINLGDVKVMPIISPKQADQEEFARRVMANETIVNFQRASLYRFDELICSLQDRAFRGEL